MQAMDKIFNNSKRLLIISGVGISLIAVVALLILFQIIKSINSEKPIATKLDDNDRKVISSVVSFSDVATETYQYQSPIYNFEATFNTKEFSYSETSRGVNLYNSDYGKQISINVDKKAATDTLTSIVTNFEKYNQFQKNFKVISKASIIVAGGDAVKIIYSYQNYSGKTVSVMNILLLSDAFVYQIQFVDYSAAEMKGTELDSLLSSFKYIDSSKLNLTSTYSSSIWGYEIVYDSKYWVLGKSDYSFELDQRKFEADPNNMLSFTINSEEISRSDLSKASTTYLKDRFEKRIGELTTSTYKKIEIVKTSETEIAGRKAYKIDYKSLDDNTYSAKNYTEYMFLHYNTLSKITINYGDSSLLKITDAMISSLKINEPTRGIVKGITSNGDSDEKAAILTKPAVAQIFFQRCGSISIPANDKLPKTAGKSYDFCAAGTGSGFFINADGYVATNGHVVSMSKADFISNAINIKFMVNLFRDVYIPQLEKANPTIDYSKITDSQILTLAKEQPTILYDLIEGNKQAVASLYGNLKLTDSIFVQKGTGVFSMSDVTSNLKNPLDHLKAKLVDIDFDENALSATTEKASDIAILKVDGSDYPMIHLGDNKYTIEGAQVIAVGFPSAANSLEFINTQLESQETFTKGLVSRIITTTGNRKLIQIDASINKGNSGGPLVNTQDVTAIGLVTYAANSQTGNYNYARDIQDLKELMTKNNIENKAGKTQDSLDLGINYFFEGKYSKAVDSLQRAQSSYPDLEGVDKIIGLAEDKIAQGLDFKEEVVKKDDLGSYINSLSTSEKILFSVVTCLICVVMILTFAMVMVFTKVKSSAKRKQAETLAAQAPATVSIPVNQGL
jgi:S1-C subfamily serine protease